MDSFYEFGPGRGQVSIDDYWLPSQQEQQGEDHRRSLSSADQDSVTQEGCLFETHPLQLINNALLFTLHGSFVAFRHELIIH